MIEYGLTEKGFVVKPYSVIREEEETEFKGYFGQDIDTSDDSIEGVYIKNQSLKIAQLWEMLGQLYAIGDVDDAFGVYLDRLVNFVNVIRMAATATQVYECIWAEEGVTLLKGHMLRMGDNGKLFKSVNTITANKSYLLGFKLKIEGVYTHTYQFTFDAHIIEYFAQEDDDEELIQDGLAAAIELQYPGKYDFQNLGTDGLIVHSKEGTTPFAVSNSDKYISFPLYGMFSRYDCIETGPIVVPIGALNTIINKVNGLESCTNYASGITGRDVESDSELRIHLQQREKQATANEVAIRNAILNINGVQYAEVYSNRDIEEINGRPGKSYESVVVGGDDQEIAEAIFKRGPAGIQAFGNITKIVKDDNDTSWVVGFSRPTNRYIWIKVAVENNSEEQLSPNWIQEIKNNIVSWSTSNLNVATDLIYQKMFRPVYDVQGIGFADIKASSTFDLTPPDDTDYRSENIVIGEIEIALIDASRIIVSELDHQQGQE
jgi:uncharacterized phage protein gp47/JayE